MAVVAGITGVLLVLFALRAWPLINVVETGRTPEYPDITPRVYRVSTDRVFDAALHAVHWLPRWSLVSSRPETGEIRVEAKTLMLRFVDAGRRPWWQSDRLRESGVETSAKTPAIFARSLTSLTGN